MGKSIISNLNKTFEEAVGNEFWVARELHEFLGYSEWRNFSGVIERAKKSLLCGQAFESFT